MGGTKWPTHSGTREGRWITEQSIDGVRSEAVLQEELDYRKSSQRKETGFIHWSDCSWKPGSVRKIRSIKEKKALAKGLSAAESWLGSFFRHVCLTLWWWFHISTTAGWISKCCANTRGAQRINLTDFGEKSLWKLFTTAALREGFADCLQYGAP